MGVVGRTDGRGRGRAPLTLRLRNKDDEERKEGKVGNGSGGTDLGLKKSLLGSSVRPLVGRSSSFCLFCIYFGMTGLFSA